MYFKHEHNSLKRCPFCGSKPNLESYEVSYRIVCGKCGCTTDWLRTKEEAIRIWNTRYYEDKEV